MQRSLALVFALVLAACGGAAPQPATPMRPQPAERPRPEVPHFDAPDGGGDGG